MAITKKTYKNTSIKKPINPIKDLTKSVKKIGLPVLQRPTTPYVEPDQNDTKSFGGWETWIANNPGGTLDQFKELIALPTTDPNAIHGGTGNAYEKKSYERNRYTPIDDRLQQPATFSQQSPTLGAAIIQPELLPNQLLDPNAAPQPVNNSPTNNYSGMSANSILSSKRKNLTAPASKLPTTQVMQPVRKIFRILPISLTKKFA